MRDAMHLGLDTNDNAMSKELWLQTAPGIASPRSANSSDATPKRSYLWPSRYFHYCMFYDRKAHQTCWLPEGYNQ